MSGKVPLLQAIFNEAKQFVNTNYSGYSAVAKNEAIRATMTQLIDLMKLGIVQDIFAYVKTKYP